MTTRSGFDVFYRENYDRLSLGDAFCRYFNVDDLALKAQKDDKIAQENVDEYFRKWGVI
jgi:hypothetical protein